MMILPSFLSCCFTSGSAFVTKRFFHGRRHGAAAASSSSSSSTGSYQLKNKRPLFVDSDVGFDDILAISPLLNTKSNINANSTAYATSIPFISTVGGIQSCPDRSARFLQKIFPAAKVFPGRAQKPLDDKETPTWLLTFRNGLNGIMDSFDIGVVNSPRKDSSAEIAEFLKDYEDLGVDLMCLGPLTNIASWINDEHVFPLVQSKINHVWIMGGNIPGADEAEFNFAQDPRAVATVLGNEVMSNKIRILPAQTCQKCAPSSTEWKELMEKGKNGTGIISKVLCATASWDDLKYDPMCAFSYAMPQSISYSKMHIKVNEETGLLLLPTAVEEDGYSTVKIIVDVTIDTEEGFLNWLSVGIDHDKPIIKLTS
jgi:inosine-uridine nucleoside N-ribohydrolase